MTRAVLTLVLLCSACDPIVVPQVLLRIDAAPEIRERVAQLRVRVFSQEGIQVSEVTARPGEGPGEFAFPATVPLTPEGNDATRRWRVEVDVFETNDAPGERGFATLRAEGRYVDDQVVELLLRLDDSCSISCDAGQTCADGVCRGACFDVTGDGRPLCGECERCELGACVARDDGAACGCPGDGCFAGACTVARTVDAVATGLDATCAIVGPTLYCWGAGAEGQLGLEPPADLDRPTALMADGDPRFRSVDVGGYEVVDATAYGAAVTGDGSVYGWGNTGAGRLGPGPSEATPTRRMFGVPLEQIALGGAHSCSRTRDRRVLCVGRNVEGQLGRGITSRSEREPADVPAEAGWVDVATGHVHSCAVDASGQVLCWGSNVTGQLGLPGDLIDRDAPTAVDLPVADFRAITSGAFHSCALRRTGEAYCWGGAAFGNLGRPNVTGEAPPAPVALEEPLEILECGRSHCCAVARNGQLWCWGKNGLGEVGIGEVSEGEPLPRAVAPGAVWTQVDGGERHSCAIRDDGALFCWGDNARGQLGTGDRSQRTVPTRVCF